MTGFQRGPTTMTATMFMLVVTFIVASTTAFALTGVVDEAQKESPIVALEVDVSDGDVVITHEHGESLEVATLELVVRRPDGVERIPFTEFAADESDDGRLDAGERVRLGHGLPSDTVELRVVSEETVLVKQRLAVA